MPKAAKAFFDLQKEKVERCLHPSLQCRGKAIRAHSIQNSKVLDLLESEGHVTMMYPKLSMYEPPRGEFKRVGRNDASTFTGLCSTHDNEMFKEIDNEEFNTQSDVHRFQIAKRAAMKEIHTLIEAATRTTKLFNQHVALGLIPRDTPSPAGFAMMMAWEKAHKVYRHIGRIDLASANPEVLEHVVFEFVDQEPTIAVSSLFFVGDARNGDIIAPTLNVVPVSADKTVVLISFLAAQRAPIRAALAGTLNAEVDCERKRELSKVILHRVENFVISQKQFDGWSEGKKKRVTDAFNASLSGRGIEDHDDLMLF